ncbi:MAG: DUF4080 domain-containing protein [Clostridiaceae bacterium]|nr:DUF4080 domain-containing protein [Clostridiaceae bacterium]
MKTIITTLNSRYSHSCLAIRYLEKYCAQYAPVAIEFSINDNINTVYSRLVQHHADIYCFSCYIWNITQICRLAEMIKIALPQSIIVFGGPQAEAFDYVDYLIMGEGEQALYYLLGCLKNGGTPPRIIKKETDLTKIPLPYTKSDILGQKNKIIYFETSRGCPFDCTYCLSSIDKRVRYFPWDYVEQALSLFFQNDVPIVKLVDRTFNCNSAWAEKIIDYTINNSKCTCVHLEIAPHLLTQKQITLLCSTPHLFKLEMGIQSTNQKTLAAINRTFDLEKAAQNIRQLGKSGIKMHLDLIAGLPFEDYASFKGSFDYVYSLQPDMLQLGFLKVLKNTAMETQPGIYYSKYPPFEVLKTDWLSAHEVCKLQQVENAVDRFYNSGIFAKTINSLTSNTSAFSVFEQLGTMLAAAEEDGKESRYALYDLLFSFGGNSIAYQLALDFLENNKHAPLPGFINRTAPEGYNTAFKKYTKQNNICLNDVRIEPIFDKIFLFDYKNKTTKIVSNDFWKV